MKLHVSVQPSEAARGRATYRQTDLTLEYSHTWGPQASELSALDALLGVRESPDWLINADTLVLVFSSNEAALRAFDAYSNREQWDILRMAAPPTPSGAGRLVLRNRPSDKRIALGTEPRYAYAAETRLLEIKLANGAPHSTAYYTISDHLIVGVHADSLSSLYVLDLEVL